MRVGILAIIPAVMGDLLRRSPDADALGGIEPSAMQPHKRIEQRERKGFSGNAPRGGKFGGTFNSPHMEELARNTEREGEFQGRSRNSSSGGKGPIKKPVEKRLPKMPSIKNFLKDQESQSRQERQQEKQEVESMGAEAKKHQKETSYSFEDFLNASLERKENDAVGQILSLGLEQPQKKSAYAHHEERGKPIITTSTYDTMLGGAPGVLGMNREEKTRAPSNENLLSLAEGIKKGLADLSRKNDALLANLSAHLKEHSADIKLENKKNPAKAAAKRVDFRDRSIDHTSLLF
jgi:hypothetical protein